MPLVSIRLVAGRSTDELRTLAAAVSEAVATTLDVPIERVGVHLIELPADRIARGGRLVADGDRRPAD